jgi:hypothetical protein
MNLILFGKMLTAKYAKDRAKYRKAGLTPRAFAPTLRASALPLRSLRFHFFVFV